MAKTTRKTQRNKTGPDLFAALKRYNVHFIRISDRSRIQHSPDVPQRAPRRRHVRPFVSKSSHSFFHVGVQTERGPQHAIFWRSKETGAIPKVDTRNADNSVPLLCEHTGLISEGLSRTGAPHASLLVDSTCFLDRGTVSTRNILTCKSSPPALMSCSAEIVPSSHHHSHSSVMSAASRRGRGHLVMSSRSSDSFTPTSSLPSLLATTRACLAAFGWPRASNRTATYGCEYITK